MAGSYYLLVYRLPALPHPTQNIELKAEIISFQIREVMASSGGNTGNVTVQLRGAKFTPDMAIRLEKPGLDTVVAHKLFYVSSAEVYITLNLNGAAVGQYDVVAEKPQESATLGNGFQVLAGDAGTGLSSGNTGGGGAFTCTIVNTGNDHRLEKNYQYPASVRLNQVVPITLQFGNGGLVDIPAPTRLMVSLGGTPLALEAKDVPKTATKNCC
ncbi:MAG: hypothetical protein IPM98_15700 [Lewinellaceae bacterium]|nr:hypothetical protein [Lewinellaceae bacterium]